MLGDRLLRRVAVEIRFEHNGRFVDNRGRLLDIFASHWEWRQFKHDRIRVRSEGSNMEAEMTWNWLRFNMEVLPSFEEIRDAVQRALPDQIWRVLRLSRLAWLGCRSMMVYPVPEKEFGALVDHFRRYYSVPKSSWDILESTLSDVGLAFVLEPNEQSKVNLTFGPMEKSQMKTFFALEDGLPGVGVFVDCDYTWRDGCHPNAVGQFMSEATRFADKKVSSFVTHLLGDA